MMDSEGQDNHAMEQALLSSKTLDNLSNQILSELYAVFGLPSNNQTIKSLKHRIGGICITQKQNYQDYLSLKKFQNLTGQASDFLNVAFQEIWKNYKVYLKKLNEQRQNQKVLKYMPKLQNLSHVQSFHLKLWQNYLKSDLCPLNAGLQKLNMRNSAMLNQQPLREFPPIQEFRRQSMNQYHNKTGNYGGFRPRKQYNFPFFPNPIISQTSDINQRKNLYNNENKVNNVVNYESKLPRNMFQNQRKTSKQRQQRLVVSQKNLNNISSFEQQQNFPSEQMMDQEDNNYDLESYQNTAQLQSNKAFQKCVCKGKRIFKKNSQNQQNKFFKCKQCNSCFHDECMLIDTDSKKQCLAQDKKCIICIAEQVNKTWYELQEEHLSEGWFLTTKQQTHQIINIQQKVLQKRLPKGQIKNWSKWRVIIRILRATIQKKQKQNSKTKYRQLTLGKDQIQFLRDVVHKIDIQFINEGEQIIQPFYSYYGVYLLRQKDTNEIVQSLQKQHQNNAQSHQKSWIQRHFQAHPDAIQVQILHFGEPIRYPFRGNNCQHVNFLNLDIQLNKHGESFQSYHHVSQCDICKKQIDKIEIDFELMNMLKNINEQGKDYPQTIVYLRSGEIKFIDDADDDVEQEQEQQQPLKQQQPQQQPQLNIEIEQQKKQQKKQKQQKSQIQQNQKMEEIEQRQV